jgi:CP family cyanate transporter-like MFS transporter
VPSGSMSRYALLWCLGVYLRLGVLIVPPLIPRLEALLGFSAGQVALATSLPSLLIGVCALIGGWLVGRLGAVPALAAGLAIMAAGSALRSVPASFEFFLLVTMLMGAGIALMQIGMPVLARSWLPARVGRASAVYTNGLLAGELMAAGLTGPLATYWLGEQWLLSFALWMLPVPLLILALLLFRLTGAPAGAPPPTAQRPRVDWRDPLLWRVGIIMGCAGALYYSGNIFLAPILGASDRIELLSISLSALNGFQLFASVALVIFADRLLGRRGPLWAAIGLGLAMIPALLWLPGYGVFWASGLLGIAAASLFTLSMTLPAWLVPVHQIAPLAAGVVLVGNVLAFAVPVVGGWLKDLTGMTALAFVPTILLSLLALACSGSMQRRHAPEQA